jgi:manganese transport protein
MDRLRQVWQHLKLIRANPERLNPSRYLGPGLLVAVFWVKDAFQALVLSQVVLSVYLPVTIILQIHLTSSPKVMGQYANSGLGKVMLWSVAGTVILLNLLLLRAL